MCGKIDGRTVREAFDSLHELRFQEFGFGQIDAMFLAGVQLYFMYLPVYAWG